MNDTNHSDATRSDSGATAASTALSDRYLIEEEIGRGGMGLVYRGKHKHLDTPVAIKKLLPGIERERFLREAQLLARAKSSHVVAVHDFEFLPDDSALLVMELLDGESLDKLLKRRTLIPQDHALPWMKQVASALASAGDLGIVHRDVKPSNIQIDARGQAKLMDFGLARSDQLSHALTVSGSHLGTPFYMSPEQAEDPRSVDVRADIYSYGATFYHVLTGRPPFEAPTAFGVMFKHKTEPLAAPQSLNPNLSNIVAQVIERCLAKSPASRFDSFHEILRCLGQSGEPARPWQAGDVRIDSPLYEQFRRRFVPYLKRSLGNSPDDTYQFSTGRKLRVALGDITREQADAIVSSDNSSLTMDYGVSLAIGRAAGKEIDDLAQKFVPVLPGRVVITPAGKLKSRFIFHAVTNGYVRQPMPATRDLIAELVSAIFYHADTLSVETIALPLLGAGGARLPEEDALEALFLALARHLERGITSVREVKLVLFPNASFTLQSILQEAYRRADEMPS
jgi:serine/threonine protein kinase